MADDNVQTPKRRRWGFWGWTLMAVVGVGVLVLATWGIWLAGATRQKNLALQEARDAGLPTTPAELLADLKPVPDDANVAIDLLAAGALIAVDGEVYGRWRQWTIPEPAMTEAEQAEHAALLADLVAEQSAAIERVAGLDAKIPPATKRARADAGAWSGLKQRLDAGETPVLLEILLPALNEYRGVANLLAADAKVAAANGDGERALRQIVRLLGIADAVDDDGHTLIEHLVAIDIRALAADTTTTLVRDHGDALATAPPALRRDVTALLLREDGGDGWREALQGELVSQNDMIDALLDGRATSAALGMNVPATGSIGRPILRGDQAQIIRWLTEQIQAADAETLPEYESRTTPAELAFDMDSVTDLFASILAPSLERAAEAEYRDRVDRRLAAVALAVLAYRTDHAGQLPPTLDALVPTYLPFVPRDALAADAPLRYDPTREILWSVGMNQTDDEGSTEPLQQVYSQLTEWNWLDYVVPLTQEAYDRLFPPLVDEAEGPTTQPDAP